MNHALSNMHFRAAVATGKPWSLSQIGDPPAYTYPFDRHYIGGGYLTSWLTDQYGVDAFERTMRLYNRWPFFGFGAALWTSTGTPPWKMGRRFRKHAADVERRRQDQLGEITKPSVLWGEVGVQCRRPVWLDNDRIVVHASGYALRPGFYSVDAATEQRELIRHEAITEDYWFHLDRLAGEILFARYRPSVSVSVKETSDLFLLNVPVSRSRKLTHGSRTFAPTRLVDGSVLALRNDGQDTEIVRISDSGEVNPLAGPRGILIKELLAHPIDVHAYALVNDGGRQGVDLVRVNAAGDAYELEPIVYLKDGSIYDPVWSSEGQYLVFAADPGGVANLYVFTPRDSTLGRLTNVAFAAFEPSLAPDNGQVAFVHFEYEQYQLAKLDFDPATAVDVTDKLASKPNRALQSARRTSDKVVAGNLRRYRPVDRLLLPRAVFPFVTVDEEDLDPIDTEVGLGLGATIAGTDPLQVWAYGLTGYVQSDQLWGSFEIQTGNNLLRPALRIWSEPFTAGVLDVDLPSGVQRVRRGAFEEQGARLSTTVPLRLARNVHSTTARFQLLGEIVRYREMDEQSQPLGAYATRATIEPRASLGLRLQANRRDLMPNTGFLLTTSAEADVYTSDRVPRRRAIRTDMSYYVPWLSRWNQGIKLSFDLLVQNRGSVFNIDTFLPRGFEDRVYLGEGTFAKIGVEHRFPIRYVDNGLFILPISLEAIYAFWFAETLSNLDNFDARDLTSSVGAGVGVRLRAFHHLRLDLRLGAARLLERNEWEVITR
jgi:hypothetical protein